MDRLDAVPHLKTSLGEPLSSLEKHLLDSEAIIESWMAEQWQRCPPLLNASVDIRNAGYKIAPVDTNLFPAGFNNLYPEFMELCVNAVKATLLQWYPAVNHILVVPESHTRNLFYLESVAVLIDIIERAGFGAKAGSLIEGLDSAQTLELPSGKALTLHPIRRVGDRLQIDGFNPELIWLNNDLVDGIPDILRNLNQMVRPALSLSWACRLKSIHFNHYQEVAKVLCDKIDIDPWLMTPMHRMCGTVDFMARVGTDCLEKYTDQLIQSIQEKYDEYQIKEKPYVVIKADAGSYGLGVMTVHDAKDIPLLNRKERERMSKTKGNTTITKAILQEGVYTFERIGEASIVAEPVVYTLGERVVGGFYRAHEGKCSDENLNTPGMHFEPLIFADCCTGSTIAHPRNDQSSRFYAYGVVARLAMLAAAKELKVSSEP